MYTFYNLFSFNLLLLSVISVSSQYIADVTKFGAIGDGKTDDSSAIVAAISSITSHNEGILFFPTGSYLTAPFNLTSNCEVQLSNATLLATTNWDSWSIIAPLPSYGRGRDFPGPRYTAFIHVVNCTNVTIRGIGGSSMNFVDARGQDWWQGKKNGTLKVTPGHLFESMWSSSIHIHDVTFLNSPFWFTHLWSSQRIHIHDLVEIAPRDSPNTDGFDPDSSSDVLIERVSVINGDDCIAIKSGWDEFGVSYGVPSTNITFRDSICDSGNVIAVGSEMSGGVDGVFVSNITGIRGGEGLNVKSSLGRGGYVRNVVFTNSVLYNVKVALRAGDNYGDDPGPIDKSLIPIISGIFIDNITAGIGATIGQAGFFLGLDNTNETKGMITGVTITNVDLGNPPLGWSCVNVTGTSYNVKPKPCSELFPPN
jgi:polygalacturonase